MNRRVLVTGATVRQAGVGRRLKIENVYLTFVDVLIEALGAAGYDVDHRAVTPGEDLSAYARAVVFLAPVVDLHVSHVHGALWALHARPDAFIGLDDWQVRKLESTIRTLAKRRGDRDPNGELLYLWHSPIALGRPGRDAAYATCRDELEELVTFLASGRPWRHRVLAPLFPWGDPSAIGSALRAGVDWLDPSPLVATPAWATATRRAEHWVSAALGPRRWIDELAPTLAWPIERLGYVAGPDGKRIKTARVAEAAVVQAYANAWGALAARYDHPDSGWWRSRFNFTAATRTIIVTSPDDAIAKVSKAHAVDPRDVEIRSNNARRHLADDQRDFMFANTWTRDKLLAETRRLLGGARAAVPAPRKETPVTRSTKTPRGAKPPALGAYIFAGGFSYGVRDHFDVRAHFEDGPYGTDVAKKIWPKLPIHTNVDAWPWEDYVDQVAFLFGNPPCAAWSPLGPRAQRGIDAWLRDPRVDCTRAHFQLLELIRPTVWAWESVPQAFTTGRSLVDHLTRRAEKLGYAVDYVLHNAQYLGALQSRRRFFMVASRVEIDWSCPWLTCPTAVEALASTPADADSRGIEREYYPLEFLRMLKPGDALRVVYPEFLAKLQKRYPAMTEEERKKKAPRPSFGERRLPADRPSGAVVDSMILHPTENRYLTIGEMKHLGGYPVGMPLEGVNHDARAGLLTRAVLPPVGRWLADQVRAGVDRNLMAPAGRVRQVNFFSPPGDITTLS